MASKELGELVEMLRAGGTGFGTEGDLTAMRASMDALAATPPADVTVEAGTCGGVPGEWLNAPGARPGTALIWLHGGGYVLGSAKSHRDLAARLGRAAGLRVFSVEYRLAPEHPFPAAVDDATAAYRGLLAIGTDPSRIAIAGDSAGGGLTLATVAALNAAGDPVPAAAVAISPWTDLALTGVSHTERLALDPILASGPAGVAVTAGQYLGRADARNPLASPLYADYHGFPPLLIQVGTSEVLFADAARVAARACEAGAPVCFEPWDQMIHSWHVFAALLPEARAAIERVGAWLRERIPATEAAP